MRDKMKVKSNVSNLQKEDGSFTNTDKEVADTLKDVFKSVFTDESNSELPDFQDRVDEDRELSDIYFTEEDVYKKLCMLKEDKAAGPDEVNPIVLKRCAECLKEPLYLLFRMTLDSGQIPEDSLACLDLLIGLLP